MDQLWAPWRLEYIAATPRSDAPKCFLCHSFAANHDRQHGIVSRTAASGIVLNRYPYNNGHLLVAPLAHKASLAELSEVELLDLQNCIRSMVGRLTNALAPDGFNVGLNLGRVAGAGLPGHLHWHIVPRWNGDTNFMPVIGDTKVISQSLEALYELLANPVDGVSPTIE